MMGSKTINASEMIRWRGIGQGITLAWIATRLSAQLSVEERAILDHMAEELLAEFPEWEGLRRYSLAGLDQLWARHCPSLEITDDGRTHLVASLAPDHELSTAERLALAIEDDFDSWVVLLPYDPATGRAPAHCENCGREQGPGNKYWQALAPHPGKEGPPLQICPACWLALFFQLVRGEPYTDDADTMETREWVGGPNGDQLLSIDYWNRPYTDWCVRLNVDPVNDPELWEATFTVSPQQAGDIVLFSLCVLGTPWDHIVGLTIEAEGVAVDTIGPCAIEILPQLRRVDITVIGDVLQAAAASLTEERHKV